MKVVTLNATDIVGGAARSAWRLHCGLRRTGITSSMLVRTKASTDPDVSAIQAESGPAADRQVQRWANFTHYLIHANRTDRSSIFYTLPVPGYDLARHPAVQAADIIHLHWVYGLLSPAGIQRLIDLGKPVLWTLHDQRPFTGGCHFSFGCEKFTSDCQACPELGDNSFALAHRVLDESLKAMDAARIVVITPSRWLADCARRSAVFGRSRIEVIPNSLELEVFRPQDREAARAALGFSPDTLVWLWGAESTHERRKGFHVLEQALRLCLNNDAFAAAMRDGRVKLVRFGKEPEGLGRPQVPVQALGYVENDQELARVYAAADLLICPTLADNLPNVILEARACGTPVLASRVGGVGELVVEGETGELFEAGNAQELSERLLALWRKPERLREWVLHSRKFVGGVLTLDEQARRCVELYQDLLKTKHPASEVPETMETLPLVPPSWPELASLESPQPRVSPAHRRTTELKLREAELVYGPGQGAEYRPSWSRPDRFLNRDHAHIWGPKKLRRALEEAESQKLYEMGFYNGTVILEVGVFGGHGAAVALKGALAASSDRAPQYYGVSTDPYFLDRALPVLRKAGVASRCLLYRGRLQQFLEDLPIVPTMVYLRGDRPCRELVDDLRALSRWLAPGTLILGQAYGANGEVRQAVDQVLRTAAFEMSGLFANSILLRATELCPGTPRALEPGEFNCLRAKHLRGRLPWILRPRAWRARFELDRNRGT